MIKPDRLVEVSIILRVLDDALITFEESRRIRIDIFAYWNSPEANEHLLTFFRQQKIYEQLAGVRVRRLGGDADGARRDHARVTEVRLERPASREFGDHARPELEFVLLTERTESVTEPALVQCGDLVADPCADEQLLTAMVAPERDTPGIMARHWAKPIASAIGIEKSMASW